MVPAVVGEMCQYQIHWQKYMIGHDTLLHKVYMSYGVWMVSGDVFMVSEGIWG